MPPASLYIHVPFCHRRCPYCSFYHVPSSSGAENAFVEALVEEARQTLGEYEGKWGLETVYFGGGTPSTLSESSWTRIFGALDGYLPGGGGAEITCEFNPEDVSPGLLEFLASRGVNRVSLGIQSMDAASQKKLTRCPPPVNSRAIEMVTAVFENVSFDVLLGIPGASGGALVATLDRLLEHRPSHFSVYCLEPGGDMGHRVQPFFDEVDADRSADEYLAVCDRLAGAGYAHYEVSNFALPGRESRHNRAYWESREYLGFGPAAHSFVEGRRFHNPPSLDAYLDAAAGNTRAGRIFDGEPTAGEAETERLMLALRTDRGVDTRSLHCSRTVIDDILREGFAVVEEGRLKMTDRGYLLLNEIVLRLLGDRESEPRR